MRICMTLPLGLALLATPAIAQDSGYRGPIIDTHAHIRLGDDDGLRPDHPRGTAPLAALDDAAGIAQSALIVIARAGQIEKTRAQNDAVIAAAKNSGGRFFPIASVHPADGDAAMAELDRLASAGIKVIKLHPNTQNFDVSDPAVGAVVEHCGEKGLIVLFDSYKPTDPAEMGKFLMLSLQHPKTRFILAHMGFTLFRDTLSFATVRKLGLGGNVYFDLSAIATELEGSPMQPELVWTIRKIGVDHFLFGSDWPVDTPAAAERAVRSMAFTVDEQRRIFHDNAAGLIGLK